MEIMDNNTKLGIKIVTVGVGDIGTNMINKLIKFNVKGIDIVTINTNKQHLTTIPGITKKVLIGETITNDYETKDHYKNERKAAEIDQELIKKELIGTNIVFICAGIGNGTGATPIIAQLAKEQGAMTIAMVTSKLIEHKKTTTKDILELKRSCDSVIIIDNDKLEGLVPDMPMNKTLEIINKYVYKTIDELVSTITQPSLIGLDYTNFKTTIENSGISILATGIGKGTDKVNQAVIDLLKNKLSNVNYERATGALILISGGSDLTLGDSIKIYENITKQMSTIANVKYGARIIQGNENNIELLVIVTGVIEEDYLICDHDE